jgi:hypothetical protein
MIFTKYFYIDLQEGLSGCTVKASSPPEKIQLLKKIPFIFFFGDQFLAFLDTYLDCESRSKLDPDLKLL